jgi:hypothetical protein
MSIKLIVIVIIISVGVGAGIFFWSRDASDSSAVTSNADSNNLNDRKVPPSTPTPSAHPPIDKNSNLKEEAAKLALPDFSKDYEDLKAEVNSSF